MVVVAIISVLAAIAIPSFINYVRRAKTSEAAANLKLLYTGAQSYYLAEHWMGGAPPEGATLLENTRCVTGNASPTYMASAAKYVVDWDVEAAEYRTIAYSIADSVYYEYHIVSGAGTTMCRMPPGNLNVYTFVARGDLDGDGTQSTFELAVGSTSNNELYRGPALYAEQELE
jgi:type II secretory pathway pseudopilin PulG